MIITFKDIEKEVFDNVSNDIKNDSKLYSQSVVKYDGSMLYGKLTIECSDSTQFQKMLEIVDKNLNRK